MLRNSITKYFFLMLLLLPTFAINGAVTQEYEYSEPREKCERNDPLRQPFFGDLHVHTKYSLDASTQGTRTTPAQAYQFALGKRLDIQPWTDDGKAMRSMQLERPLDFAGVTDHAELFGEVDICHTPGMDGYGSWTCMVYRHLPRVAFYVMNGYASQGKRFGFCGEGGEGCRLAGGGPWREMQQAAEDFYDRSSSCNFTSFVAYEWTGASENLGNTHRNVIFRNDDVPELPISSIDSKGLAVNLYNQLDHECVEADGRCDVIIIPHNSNISDGFMFKTHHEDGSVITAQDAKQRARLETLVELIQHKGSSECFYQTGFNEDELCAFEQLPYDKFSGKFQSWTLQPPQANDGFVREVLREGMVQEKKLGVNPFKIGFIGSTDTHLGAPGAVNERKFYGHGGAGVPADSEVPAGLVDDLEFSPGGLAAVWAEENSRDSLFDAMKRRETFATSGPRISVRFFGGWDYPNNLCAQLNSIEQAYEGGVPMGSDLPEVIEREGQMNRGPQFFVVANQDVGTVETKGTPLQRLQIIKGWVDELGDGHEKVYEVAGNPKNGASVDLANCSAHGAGYSNLCTVWKDPDFSAEDNSYYYARAVENPSCRWSQHICAANKVDCSNEDTITEGLEGCCAPEHRPVIQERAVTSPIWYSNPSI